MNLLDKLKALKIDPTSVDEDDYFNEGIRASVGVAEDHECEQINRITELRDEATSEMRSWKRTDSNYWMHNAERAAYNEALAILEGEQ